MTLRHLFAVPIALLGGMASLHAQEVVVNAAQGGTYASERAHPLSGHHARAEPR